MTCHPGSPLPATHTPPAQTEAVLSAPLRLVLLTEEGLPCFMVAVTLFKITYNSLREALPIFFDFSFVSQITCDILF